MDTAFRGVQQEFNNTFNYDLPTAVTAPSETLVDEIVPTLKSLTSTLVNFKRASVWTSGGTQAQNQMIFQKNLTGTGTGTGGTNMDKERALLFRWPAGFNSRGKPVYLRKWVHIAGGVTGASVDVDGIKQNTQQIGATDRTLLAGRADELRNVGTSSVWEICAKSGRKTTGPAECHRYLEHHQLGDAWR